MKEALAQRLRLDDALRKSLRTRRPAAKFERERKTRTKNKPRRLLRVKAGSQNRLNLGVKVWLKYVFLGGRSLVAVLNMCFWRGRSLVAV